MVVTRDGTAGLLLEAPIKGEPTQIFKLYNLAKCSEVSLPRQLGKQPKHIANLLSEVAAIVR
ncbi:hypothetical protein [Phormidesmis priestleyi]